MLLPMVPSRHRHRDEEIKGKVPSSLLEKTPPFVSQIRREGWLMVRFPQSYGHFIGNLTHSHIIYIYIYISADPGLCQGRGGAWDHRRCGSCLSWTLATPNAAGKSHHTATAMAQEHPTAAAMASFLRVQGCRLPGLKPSKPSNSSKSLPNSAGKRYPNKPNTRHARRQKPP